MAKQKKNKSVGIANKTEVIGVEGRMLETYEW